MPPTPQTCHTACHETESRLPLMSSPSPRTLQALLYNLLWPFTLIVAWSLIFFLALRLIRGYLHIPQHRFIHDAKVSGRSTISQCLFALLSIFLCPSIWVTVSIIILSVGLQLLRVYRNKKWCRTVNNAQYQDLRDIHKDTDKRELEDNPLSDGMTVNQCLQTNHHHETSKNPKQPGLTPSEHHQFIPLPPPATKLTSPHHSTSSTTKPTPKLTPRSPFPVPPLQQTTLTTPTHFPLPTIRRHSSPPGSSNSQPQSLPPLSPQRLAIPYTTLSPLSMTSRHMTRDWRKDTVMKANGCRRHVLLAQGLPLGVSGGGGEVIKC